MFTFKENFLKFVNICSLRIFSKKINISGPALVHSSKQRHPVTQTSYVCSVILCHLLDRSSVVVCRHDGEIF